MKCKWYSQDYEVCVNGACPRCADFCNNQTDFEICKYFEIEKNSRILKIVCSDKDFYNIKSEVMKRIELLGFECEVIK